MWEIEGTDQFISWYDGLTEAESDAVEEAVDALRHGGPALGRPFVDTIKTSRHSHMKELRPRGGNLRVLFVFDPRRSAILLLGGDKTARWEAWYRQAVPLADDLYDTYLDELRKEGFLE
jgi:hypothetical protein